MKSFGWMVMSSLAIFLVATSTSWAQEAAPPPLDCENDRSIGACFGEILGQQESMITELEEMMGDMQGMNLFSLAQRRLGLAAQGSDMQADLEGRIASLKRRRQRAVEVMAVVSDDEIDEMIARADTEKGKKCKPTDKPFFDSLEKLPNGTVDFSSLGLQSTGPKFGNDRCDIFNAVDLAGNDVKVHEKKEGMCETVCEVKMVGGQSQMGKSKDRLVDDLLEAIGSNRDAMQSLSAQRARMSELGLLFADLRLSEADSQLPVQQQGDPCVSEPSPPGIDYIAVELLVAAEVVLDIIIVNLAIGSEILEAINDIGEKACLQVVAGFNGSTACVVLVRNRARTRVTNQRGWIA